MHNHTHPRCVQNAGNKQIKLSRRFNIRKDEDTGKLGTFPYYPPRQWSPTTYSIMRSSTTRCWGRNITYTRCGDPGARYGVFSGEQYSTLRSRNQDGDSGRRSASRPQSDGIRAFAASVNLFRVGTLRNGGEKANIKSPCLPPPHYHQFRISKCMHWGGRCCETELWESCLIWHMERLHWSKLATRPPT